MRITRLLVILIVVSFASCASHPVNQYKNGMKSGVWVYKNKNTDIYSKGKYDKGIETGVWKYYQGEKLWKRERYRGNISDVKIYYPDKRVSSKGQTRLDITGSDIHWYYTGDWKYYNNRGKLTEIRTFEKGRSIHDRVYWAKP